MELVGIFAAILAFVGVVWTVRASDRKTDLEAAARLLEHDRKMLENIVAQRKDAQIEAEEVRQQIAVEKRKTRVMRDFAFKNLPTAVLSELSDLFENRDDLDDSED